MNGKTLAWIELTMLDRVGLVTPSLRDFDRLMEVEGITADVFDWAETAGGGPFDAITVNHSHHFDDAERASVFTACVESPLLLATEPRGQGSRWLRPVFSW